MSLTIINIHATKEFAKRKRNSKHELLTKQILLFHFETVATPWFQYVILLRMLPMSLLQWCCLGSRLYILAWCKPPTPRDITFIGVSCVPTLQLWHCIYRRDEESPRDPHKRAQSCHQMGRDGKVGHSGAHLGTTTSNTVGGDQRVGPSKE